MCACARVCVCVRACVCVVAVVSNVHIGCIYNLHTFSKRPLSTRDNSFVIDSPDGSTINTALVTCALRYHNHSTSSCTKNYLSVHSHNTFSIECQNTDRRFQRRGSLAVNTSSQGGLVVYNETLTDSMPTSSTCTADNQSADRQSMLTLLSRIDTTDRKETRRKCRDTICQ